MLDQASNGLGTKRGPKSLSAPLAFVRLRPPSTTVVFDTYWRFAAERQEILFRRMSGDAAPWTADPILAMYKFTNVYRAADRVSQYLIRSVIYRRPDEVRDTVFRTLLFKLFNKIETWQLLEETYGELESSGFDVHAFDQTLDAALAAGAAIYSAAYIMPSGPVNTRRPRKHRMHLELLARVLRDSLPERLAETCSMAEAYELLRTLPGIGPFLAYQYVIDLNYSGHMSFSEMDFVVPGPGAHDGMRKCFKDLGDYSTADVIRWVADRQQDEFSARELRFRSLYGRPLQLIDCQNLFCEVDKYARVRHPHIAGCSGRKRIKQKFAPRSTSIDLWFPPKWGINRAAAPISLQPTTGPSLL